jgi:hypothetical protein
VYQTIVPDLQYWATLPDLQYWATLPDLQYWATVPDYSIGLPYQTTVLYWATVRSLDCIGLQLDR